MNKFIIIILGIIFSCCGNQSEKIKLYAGKQIVTCYYYQVNYFQDDLMWYKQIDSLAKNILQKQMYELLLNTDIDTFHFGEVNAGEIDDEDLMGLFKMSRMYYDFPGEVNNVNFTRVSFGSEAKEGFFRIKPVYKEDVHAIIATYVLDEDVTGKNLDRFILSCLKEIDKYKEKGTRKKICFFLVDEDLKKICSLTQEKNSAGELKEGYMFKFE
ncbi:MULTISPECIES: hypothetical protein [unclassified Arcicella]|nr:MULTISPECIES: hypothetical protein [unclassified Arcicella]MDR6563972.1 hypothetical protein [Arcicella sp. BE51]MDR6813725.1 hypothetical protein [Arcicella sp. BE140]MDR6825037.1 hypothetical protein [Arcicella sp. BE139]